MRNKISELVPTRDVPLALICATAWIFVLWAVKYPADESVGVVVIAYATHWSARLIINMTAFFLLGVVRGLALRKARELGISVSEETAPAITTITRVAVAAFLLAMFLAIVGMSVAATVPIVTAVGLPPLAAGFGVFGWTALGVGALVLATIVGVPFILFKWPEKVAVNMRRLSTGISALSDILRAPLPKALAFVVNPRAG